MRGFDANTREDPYEAMYEPGAWRRLEVTSAGLGAYVLWITTPPCGHHAHLAVPPMESSQGGHHSVVEHEDGTITVSPSIACTHEAEDVVCGWHGYLEAGEWRAV